MTYEQNRIEELLKMNGQLVKALKSLVDGYNQEKGTTTMSIRFEQAEKALKESEQ